MQSLSHLQQTKHANTWSHYQMGWKDEDHCKNILALGWVEDKEKTACIFYQPHPHISGIWRFLVVHPVWDMDTDHSLRWVVDIVVEMKTVFSVYFWLSKRKHDPGSMAGHTKGLARVADDLGLGSAPGERRCQKAQTNKTPCLSSSSQKQNSQWRQRGGER